MVKRKSMFHKMTTGDIIYIGITYVMLTLLLVIVLYPLIFILSASFSSPTAVMSGRVVLWPVDFTVQGYMVILRNQNILRGFANSVFYTAVGTVVNVIITMIAAYPLSRKNLPGRRAITLFFGFTILFGGGMIPNFILVANLGLLNTRWAMIIPGALSVWNMIIARTFFETTFSEELHEAAVLDGCSEFKCFLKIILPLSKAILAVMALFYAVGHWSSFFNAFLYLTDPSLYPLQIILRQILVANQVSAEMLAEVGGGVGEESREALAELLKYSLVVVASVPMLLVYPFAQKHFVKGVMIGSVKG